MDASFPRDLPRIERIRRAIHQNRRLVCRNLQRLGVPVADVEDAAQDVFIVFSRRIDEIERERERAFLLGTATLVALSRSRSLRRRREQERELFHEHALPIPTPEELQEARERLCTFERLLGSLRAESRALLTQVDLEDVPRGMLAKNLGLPLGTVQSRLTRARAELRAAVLRLRSSEAFPRARLTGAPPV